MWSRAGTSLLEASVGSDIASDDLRVYPTRHDDGRLSVLLFNLGVESITTDFVVERLESRDDFETTMAYITQANVSFSLRGGTREIVRGIIARGLGMR